MTLDYRHADQIMIVNGNGLWLGDLQAASDIQWLNQTHIKTVITVADGFKLQYDSSIHHYRYKVYDHKQENLGQYFDDAVENLNKSLKLGSVLVHCGAGVSRSTSIIIAYLIKTRMMNFHQALKFIKDKRSVVCPNLGFQRQLKKYYQKNAAFLLFKEKKLSLPKYEDLHQPRAFTNQTVFDFNLKQKEREKNGYSTPFLKAKNEFNKGLERATMMSNYKETPKLNKTQQFPDLPISRKHFSQIYVPRYKKQRPLRIKNQNSELKKIAEFRFGITNTQKWKIF